MSSENKDPKPDETTRTVALLRELFTGQMLANVPIRIEEAQERIQKLDQILDPKHPSPDGSLASFIEKLNEALHTMDSSVAHRYGDRMQQAAKNGLAPARVALGAIKKALDDATAHKDTRDPEQRKKTAAALKKVPAAVDYILGQLESFAEEFKGAQKFFRDELEYTKMVAPGSISEDAERDNAMVIKHLENIETIFNRNRIVMHSFRAAHAQINSLAGRLEKEFMLPPSAGTEKAIS